MTHKFVEFMLRKPLGFRSRGSSGDVSEMMEERAQQ